jgi:hypothetical protein
MRPHVLGAVILLVASVSVTARETEFTRGSSLDETVQLAEKYFDGDYVVIFESTSLPEKLLSDPALHEFLAKNFAVFVVASNSDAGIQALNRVGGEGLGDRIVISANRLNNLKLHVPVRPQMKAKDVLSHLVRVNTASTYQEYAASLASHQ